jgi:hypothetical protein
LFTEEDVAACCDRQGIDIERGDAVLWHAGSSASFVDHDPYRRRPSARMPYLSPSAFRYLFKRDIVGYRCGSFAGSHRWPRANDLPRTWGDLGDLANSLWALGMYTFYCETEALARDEVYEFMLCLAPLPLVGATGSPVNPLALA